MVLVSVESNGVYCCLSVRRAGRSKIVCISSATATLPHCVQTQLALATCWPQQNGQEHLATENQVYTVETAACAYQKQAADDTAYVG
jgi:Zn ribbon nucleic-acid-binding protein